MEAIDTFITSLNGQFSSGVEKLTSALSTFAPTVIPLVVVGLVITIGFKVYKKMANKA